MTRPPGGPEPASFLERTIRFFARRHLMVNLAAFVVFAGGVMTWRMTPKEELPNVDFNWIRVTASYPGAPAADVERLVTVPLEEAVRGLDAVAKVDSSTGVGTSRLYVELQPDEDDLERALTEIRNAVGDVRLPVEVENDPYVRMFRTSRKAILDIGVYLEGTRRLDFPSRRALQQAVRSFENQLLSLPQIHDVGRSGYLDEEMVVSARPKDLYRYNIAFDDVMREIRSNHLRQPVGSLEDARESKVTIGAELDDPALLRGLVVQGGFEGHGVRLDRLADVERRHAKADSVLKINGHEGIMLNVVKSAGAGILEALDAVHAVVERFRRQQGDGPVRLVLLDDESTDLRNRLKIIATNGTIGFVLILVVLFLFLDFRSGLWVGVGIPFTFCFAIMVLAAAGFTINNMTLAGVIIVMGMVVDDAIIVAEHIHRLRRGGMRALEAAVKGTREMAAPVTAAVLTTCAAFVPLYYMEGRWIRIITVIPGVVFAMLGGSLVESILVLPSHLILDLPGVSRVRGWFRRRRGREAAASPVAGAHWFERYEAAYGRALGRWLPRRRVVYGIFGAVIVGTFALFHLRFKFVMFPREETREVVVAAEVAGESTRYETARRAWELERIFLDRLGREVVGLRTSVARSRHGGAVQENYFRITAEIVPKEERDRSADELIAEWEAAALKLPGLTNVNFAKSRWGQGSGSPVEVVVRGNDDAARERAAKAILEALQAHPAVSHAEPERDLRVPEYHIRLKRDVLKRLSVGAPAVASTFRAALQGSLVYEIVGGDEEIKVRFTADDASRSGIDRLLRVPVSNQRGYLVPLGDVVDVEKAVSPTSISRREGRRLTRVYADLGPDGGATPEDVAVHLEREVFPGLLASEPSISLEFDGEIRETRESKGGLKASVAIVVLLIFVILAVLFNSLAKPLVIMVAIPFGAVGVILAFFAHGITEFGLFASIGALGLAGVVVNDSIVMMHTVGKALRERAGRGRDLEGRIAQAARTRLRAVILTTLTTVAGILPTAYGFAGYDAMLAQMMLALAWGLIFATAITLVLIPCLYASLASTRWLEALT